MAFVATYDPCWRPHEGHFPRYGIPTLTWPNTTSSCSAARFGQVTSPAPCAASCATRRAISAALHSSAPWVEEAPIPLLAICGHWSEKLPKPPSLSFAEMRSAKLTLVRSINSSPSWSGHAWVDGTPPDILSKPSHRVDQQHPIDAGPGIDRDTTLLRPWRVLTPINSTFRPVVHPRPQAARHHVPVCRMACCHRQGHRARHQRCQAISAVSAGRKASACHARTLGV